MRNLKYFFSLLLLALTTIGCESFLDPGSVSVSDLEAVFSNTDDARKATNSIYRHFNEDAFRSRLSTNMMGCTDIVHAGGTSEGDRYQIWRLNASSSNSDLATVWETAYKAIRDCNIVIEGVQNSELMERGTVLEKQTMHNFLGEAVTIKAYWYSMLIYFWGDVPFMNEAPKAGVEFNLPKTDRNEILESLIDDLMEVEEHMAWADALPYGIEQANREYCLGMIARLALQRGGWFLKPDMTMARASDYLDFYTIARDYSKKLIELKDRALPTDYRQVFMNQCKFISPVNDDVLFEVPFPIGRGDVGWNIGIRVDAGTHPYGGGQNYMAMSPSYYYSFDQKDKRLEVTCCLYTINGSFEKELVSRGNMNISQGKWSRHFLDTPPGQASDKGTGINWPMLRYADVLLMFAEAENELNGPTAEAQAALRRVRERAFEAQDWSTMVDEYISTVSAGKERFFEALVDERSWELGGELVRKTDLIRWNLYGQKVQQAVTDIKRICDEVQAGTSTLPADFYTRTDDSGELIIFNTHEQVSFNPDPELWSRQDWLIKLYDEDNGTYAEWITRDWANYVHPVRYIFPIPIGAISASEGKLDNNGYNF
ncbi:RagB/SusD family nutrient uptake outer membrane protein [Persicobacter diffluens]|uniref:Starch-binding protein n=1 Tax=Persicobacter diffluens TaxID=981 RepID=A0AAN4W215_9BACT|nr:starch-binding protein [Persicobacter diffluens]